MIHYLDTSAFVKRYITEAGSNLVRPLFRARNVATSRITYSEIAAVIARLCRARAIDDVARDDVWARLDRDFGRVTVVEIRAPLVRSVPGLVTARPLRGYDAVHLASALTLRARSQAVTFWAADVALAEAARAEGLRTMLLA
jgi:predicted nucleic acid-binding protein